MGRKSKGAPGERATAAGGEIPVVGIGASVEGIAALEALVPLLKTGKGVAFVIVQHLGSGEEGIFSPLLEQATSIPIVQVAEHMRLEADHIYIIPNNVVPKIVKDRVHLGSSAAQRRGQRPQIDVFFQSLARAKGKDAACVMLSGTNGDGFQGMRSIKKQGGLTIVQQGADYDGVMLSAVRTGMADFVLPLDEIPAKLYDYFQPLTAIDSRTAPESMRPEAVDHLANVIALLRMRTGHDFSGYKEKTFARRVQRRMQVLQISEMPDFIERLRLEPGELDALLQDLLMGVTSFFRDPPAFEALDREVIPRLFDGKGPDGTVRVWVPGCSTGEEAYSIAILLLEHIAKTKHEAKLQIFASDIDERALDVARAGRFPSTIARNVPANRLERYFERDEDAYRITSEVRETCVFSAHNLLHDAPFSKLDLISCRNLLIYLTPDMQDRLIPLFLYALNDAGYLFLGTSENVTSHPRLFSPVDKPHRLFKRRAQLERRLPKLPLASSNAVGLGVALATWPTLHQEPLQALAERQILDRHAPAYVVTNADGDLLYGSSRTSKYLELAPGLPRIDIFSMARPGVRPDLRAAMHRSVSTGQVAIQRNVVVDTNDGHQTLDLIVQPIHAIAMQEALYMVVFQDVGSVEALVELKMPEGVDELKNEELKSGNEELASMNKELQAANEELAASKEELRSINEALQAANGRLNARIEELSEANSYIANLLEGTQIAAVFLDRNLTVKSFTPAAKDLFRLVESDAGRPITHIRARFHSDMVEEDAERVLRTLSTIERQVDSSHSDARYIMRMMPYRTVDNVIGGVVITFVDITRITAAEPRIHELTHSLRERVHSLETLLDLVPVGIMIVEDNRTDEIKVNRHGATLMGEQTGGWHSPQPVGRPRLFDGDRELTLAEQPLQRASRSGEAVTNSQCQLLRPDGRRVDVLMSATPLVDHHGKVRGGIAALVDISERKSLEARQQVLLHELQHRVKNILATITALATRMLRGISSPEEFSGAFLGRLRAMATTHELLSHGNWAGADLRELLDSTLRGQNPSPGVVAVSGPDALLTPNAAATLGMVFYELATNAAKYGALSDASGRIEVAWQAVHGAESNRLILTWTEIDGPPPPTAIAEGFGTRFVKRSVEYELQGSADIDRMSAGLRWKVEFPLKGNVHGA